MQKKLKLAVIALCCSSLAHAQQDSIGLKSAALSETAFTFTEAQLGEDDDMSQNVTIVNSNTTSMQAKWDTSSLPYASAIALSIRNSTMSISTVYR